MRIIKTLYKIFKLLFPTKFKKYLKEKISDSKKISDEKFYKVAEAYYSEKIETDGLNYEILVNAINEIREVKGIICEIGTRRGGSAKWIIDTLVNNSDTQRHFITIDPYGNIEYNHGDGNVGSKISVEGFTNKMRNETVPFLYMYALKRLDHFTFFNLEDTEFFKKYEDGVPSYSEHQGKIFEKIYALVFFDGPHDYKSITKEVKFFNSRTSSGAVYVFDDVSNYNHTLLEEEYLLRSGWQVFQKSERKISYKKVSSY
tara:strand:- start:2771 stop:3544 length:774 start_codon:yes stop_codon:yes gene_type:complete